MNIYSAIYKLSYNIAWLCKNGENTKRVLNCWLLKVIVAINVVVLYVAVWIWLGAYIMANLLLHINNMGVFLFMLAFMMAGVTGTFLFFITTGYLAGKCGFR